MALNRKLEHEYRYKVTNLQLQIEEIEEEKEDIMSKMQRTEKKNQLPTEQESTCVYILT